MEELVQDQEIMEPYIPRKFLEESGTCYKKNYPNFFSGFFTQFSESFFYANVIQCLLVSLMYVNVGKGKYWKILFYAALAGLLGSLFENGTVAFICKESEKNREYKVVSLLIAEIFWVTCEYSIPLLNLIKMRAFSKETLTKYINYTIIALFIPFTICRFMIGYERMNKGILQSNKIKNLHGFAFGIMAIADITCTVVILYFINKYNRNKESFSNAINNRIKQSSYTILIAVDITGFLLSMFDLITNFKTFRYLPTSLAIPFHCLKSSFVLILACDNLLFKYGAKQNMTSHYVSSSGTNAKQNYNDLNKSGNYKSTASANNFSYNYCTVDMTGNEPIKASNNNNSNYSKPTNNSSYSKLTNNPYTKLNNNSSYTKIPAQSTNKSTFSNIDNKSAFISNTSYLNSSSDQNNIKVHRKSNPNIIYKSKNSSNNSTSPNITSFTNSSNQPTTPKSALKNYSYNARSPSTFTNDSDKTLPQYNDSSKFTNIVPPPAILSTNNGHIRNSSYSSVTHRNSSPTNPSYNSSNFSSNGAKNFTYNTKPSPSTYSYESDKTALPQGKNVINI